LRRFYWTKVQFFEVVPTNDNGLDTNIGRRARPERRNLGRKAQEKNSEQQKKGGHTGRPSLMCLRQIRELRSKTSFLPKAAAEPGQGEPARVVAFADCQTCLP
jgi:hypothetical protein